jgi:pimeloyl-ACP methyl ester carboxylesterase
MAATQERIVLALADGVEASVEVGGSGPPVVYLHGEGGLRWDPFLDRLAERHTVYAPRHPGTRHGDPEAIRKVDTLSDLVLYYADVFEGLGLGQLTLVGHSFGGMVAAEYAATYHRDVSKLVLVDPLGLWREDIPVANWMLLKPEALRQATFSNLQSELAVEFARAQANGGADPEATAMAVWSLACTGRFTWPIPDKGLHRRLYRITADTLIVWGKDDGIVSADYAQEFARLLKTARVELISNAGHLPQLEQLDPVAAMVERFIG